MRVLSAVGRAALGGLACAAALGIPTVALADEPPAAHDPALRLHCPELRWFLWAYEGEGQVGLSPREQVLRNVDSWTAYTQAQMRGHLDVRQTPDGRVTTVVARGTHREPIGTWRFVRERTGWALRSSAECMPGHPRAAAMANTVDGKVHCRRWIGSAIIDYDAPDQPVPPEEIDHTPPDVLVEQMRERALGSDPRRYLVFGPETTYRFERTRADVIYRDPTGRPVIAYELHREFDGWYVKYEAICDNAGIAD